MKPLIDYRRIFVCLRYGIGDLIMELPALDELRRQAPAAQITALGARPAIELLDGYRRLDEVIAWQDFGFRHWGDLGDPATLERFDRWLDERKFDLLMDPWNAVLGARQRIWARGGDILDSEVPSARDVLRAGGRGADALRRGVRDGWGIEMKEAAPRVELQRHEKDDATAFLRRLGWEGIAPIGLSPVASSSLKRWPIERLAATADALLQSSRERLLIFGGPQADLADEVLRPVGNRGQCATIGAIHLRKVAALLQRCRVFIGHDTGLTHLAAAVGTPVVALFGPTSPRIYRPSSIAAHSIGGEADCPWRRTDSFGPSDCVVQARCFRERPCMEEVSVAQVLALIDRAAPASQEGASATARRYR